MLVVAADVHVVADVVEQGRHLQQQAVAIGQAVLGRAAGRTGARRARPPCGRGGRRSGTSRRGRLALARTWRRRSSMPCGRRLADEVEEQADAQRGVGHGHLLGDRLQQQLAVGQERGHQRLRLRLGQPVALDDLLDVVGRRSRRRSAMKASRVDDGHAGLRRVVAEDPRGGEAHVAAQGDEVRGLAQRHLAPDVVHHVVDVAHQQPRPLLVAALPRGQALAHADGAQGIGPGVDRLPLAQERDVRAAAAHLDQQRVADVEGGMVAAGCSRTAM